MSHIKLFLFWSCLLRDCSWNLLLLSSSYSYSPNVKRQIHQQTPDDPFWGQLPPIPLQKRNHNNIHQYPKRIYSVTEEITIIITLDDRDISWGHPAELPSNPLPDMNPEWTDRPPREWFVDVDRKYETRSSVIMYNEEFIFYRVP